MQFVMRKLLYSLCVAVLLSTTACSTVNIVDRGMEGGSMFVTASKHTSTHNRVKVTSSEHEKQSFLESATILSSEKHPDKVELPCESSVESSSNGLKPASKLHAENAPQRKHKIKETLNSKRNTVKKDNPDAGSLRWFFYLILCFVIPPIAYFLIKRNTDNMFWICLICFLLTLSFFGGFNYGILGLVSILIALLALLEINL
ncbi:MAG: hypothetical protein RLZZ161_1084 [Bacteroidota bacterium]|jgi:hypothetical protein